MSLSVSALADDHEEMAELEVVFEAAKQKLPKPLRDRLGDVKLTRAEDFGIGKEAPLEYRLLSRAAYASFSTASRELTVYDAGVLRSPTWKDGRVSRADLARLIAGVADVLQVKPPRNAEDPALDLAWAEFVKRVWSWTGDSVPDLMPEVGDGAVFTRFLRDGVWRAMGGEASMEALMVHEFGHALQLETESMEARMRYWGIVSGTINRDDGSPSDGFVGVRFGMEEMMVLIRLLLEDEPGKMGRGDAAIYQSSAQANFVNRYARYDLREDYAESFRLMTYDPERLIKTAPEKFFYLNALGWNARLDRVNPGPLWYSGDDLKRFLPKAVRVAMFRRILGVEEGGLEWHPLALAAVMRAHQKELSVSDLPEPFQVVALPDDLPKTLLQALSPELLTVAIGGKKYAPSESRQKHRQDEIMVKWLEVFHFNRGIEKFRMRGTDGAVGSYQEVVANEQNAEKRSRHFEIIRELGRDLVDDNQWKQWYLAESQFHKERDNVWLSARYSILAADGQSDEKLAQIRELGAKSSEGFERALFLATAVDVALETGDRDKVDAAIKSIPGETFGAWLRMRAYLQAAKTLDGEARQGFRENARKEVRGVKQPLLRKHLEGLLD